MTPWGPQRVRVLKQPPQMSCETSWCRKDMSFSPNFSPRWQFMPEFLKNPVKLHLVENFITYSEDLFCFSFVYFSAHSSHPSSILAGLWGWGHTAGVWGTSFLWCQWYWVHHHQSSLPAPASFTSVLSLYCVWFWDRARQCEWMQTLSFWDRAGQCEGVIQSVFSIWSRQAKGHMELCKSIYVQYPS